MIQNIAIFTISVFCALFTSKSVAADWRLPTGIVITSIGGVMALGGLLVSGSYSSDECESKYQGENNKTEKEKTCKARAKKNQNNALGIGVVGGVFVGTGIVLLTKGSKESDKNPDETTGIAATRSVRLTLDSSRSPSLLYQWNF